MKVLRSSRRFTQDWASIAMADMLPNMPHSRMTPTLPLRPSHPWPGVARGQDPRVKGRVLSNSPKSAPLTGGRFRRPAKTHEGTPSGAHFSHRCRVWRPAGGPRECRDAGCVYGSSPRVTGCGRVGPIRVRRRRLPATMRREGVRGGAARDPSPMLSPGCGLGVGRHPTPCDYEAYWGA